MQYDRKSGNTVSIRNEWRAFSHPVALARTTRTITSTTTTARPQPPLIMSTIIISTSPPQRHRPLRFSITPNTGDEAGGPPSSSHEVNVQVHSVRVSLFQRHTTTIQYTSHNSRRSSSSLLQASVVAVQNAHNSCFKKCQRWMDYMFYYVSTEECNCASRFNTLNFKCDVNSQFVWIHRYKSNKSTVYFWNLY